MPRPEVELLAPARDAEIGIEAINHGADAVYIGGPSWGARDKAGNSVAEIARLARHAHRYHARIFVTLNTILRDDELEAARRLAWQLHEAGADALIVQDMGLLMSAPWARDGEPAPQGGRGPWGGPAVQGLDLPPIQLHASTQTDIRTPEKARFLQDVGFAQMVLARELDLTQIRAIAAQVQRATLEFFCHGALCVAYSGQCFISHAHTGRSANRGNCSQECRLPYVVEDAEGRILAHDKHVLSLKDNDQSANLAALVDAGIRSFKIEGRYKDMATVKNVTAHYRRLLDTLLEGRSDLRAATSGRTTHHFTPDPERAFNRGATDYFVNGRQPDIGAFDSPKHAGLPLGHVTKIGAEHFDLQLDRPETDAVHNGDALTWWDRQGELQGVPVNTAEALGGGRWRVVPNLPQGTALAALKDLRRDTTISRNRDMAWERLLQNRKSAERLIDVDLELQVNGDELRLEATDADGIRAEARIAHRAEPARDAARAAEALRAALGKLGGTIFTARYVELPSQAWFIPPSLLNSLRRDAIAALEEAREAAFEPLRPHEPVEPPVAYPEDTLTYLANVYNRQAAAFYALHGVKVIAAAYESHEELGEVSLMITKHCVRWSLQLCPKQAKGVVGVQGTVRAEPLTLINGDERMTLRFDCRPCEMHVVGRMRRQVLRDAAREERAVPMKFYRQRDGVGAGLGLG